MKKLLFILLIGCCAAATAQERVTITDPDLVFSYVLPQDWCYKDDPLYHYISPAGCDGEQELPISLTYFNYDCPDVEVCLHGKVNGEFKSVLTDFELKDKGRDTVDGTEARWAIFTHTTEGAPVKEMIYVFVRFGQLFEARCQFQAESFDQYHAEIRRLLRSLQVKPNR
ncbi:MAG: hypothetical protein LC664_16575 [Flavobacteriales bacterium]|nr:hypothetical protein [Flavobacteriales bacterium]